ncbi:MAG TPA: glycosyltransferase family 39 protein [Terriglobales bacterium]|nr:glycosyltransferase family 39 protein [Terriglobales bacterium]
MNRSEDSVASSAAGSASLFTDRWLLGALAAALALRLPGLAAAPLWFDETITAEWMHLSWAELLKTVLTDNHPPLYFLLLRGWTELAGHSDFALRLPSALASLACVPLMAAAARLAAGDAAMRWAAWFAALSPLLIHHGQEARAYAVIALLATSHFLLVLRFLQSDSRRLRWGFGLTGAMLAWTHYYSAVFVAAQLLTVLVAAPRRWRQWLPGAVIASAGCSSAALAAMVYAQREAGGGYELGPAATAGVLWGLLTEYTLLPSSEELHAHGVPAAWRYLPAALLAALCVVPLAWWGLQRLKPQLRVAALASIAAVVIVPYAISLVMAVGSHPRYASPALAPMLLVMTAAICHPRRRRLARVALAGVALLMVIASGRHLVDPGHGREDVRGAQAWLRDHFGPSGEVVVMSEEMAQLARFHWPERSVRTYPRPRLMVTPDNAAELAEQLPLAEGKAVFVIGREWVADPKELLERELRRRYAQCGEHNVRGIRILCLTKTVPLSASLPYTNQPRPAQQGDPARWNQGSAGGDRFLLTQTGHGHSLDARAPN